MVPLLRERGDALRGLASGGFFACGREGTRSAGPACGGENSALRAGGNIPLLRERVDRFALARASPFLFVQKGAKNTAKGWPPLDILPQNPKGPSITIRRTV